MAQRQSLLLQQDKVTAAQEPTIPNNLLSLAILVASAGPGYVYFKVAEQRRPTVEKSQFFEVVELFVIGFAATVASALIVVPFADLCGLLSVPHALQSTSQYARNHVWGVVATTVGVFAFSYLLAYLASKIAHRRFPPAYRPGATVWAYELAGVGDVNPDTPRKLTVELRDGRQFIGYHSSHSKEEHDVRQLALRRPIGYWDPNTNSASQMDIDGLVVNEQDIRVILVDDATPKPKET